MENTNFNTIFDDVFRTISEKMPFLMIPLINEVFHTNYPEDFSFESLRNEHHESAGTIVTDSLFQAEDFLYHMECQSKKDGTMAIRMFQYDTAIAVEHATQTAEKQTEVHFPRSCVLYIRNHSEKDEQHTVNVHFADGQTIDYNCPILYAQNYTVDSIFEKRLLLLLPYHILRYEHFLKSNKVNEKKIQKLLNDYALIRERLNQIIEKNEQGTFYFDLIKLINQVADYIIPSDNPVKERLGNVMGGKVLTLWSEELRNEGRVEGRVEGRAEGRVEGRAEGRTAERHALCCKLHQRGMNISDIADLIQESPSVVADWIASASC